MSAQPTPAPWSEPCTYGLTKFEVQGDGKKVAVFERLEDAQHAVKCVNAYYTLVDALEWARIYVESASRRVYDGTNGQGIREEAARRLVIIDAAIAKAGSAS